MSFAPNDFDAFCRAYEIHYEGAAYMNGVFVVADTSVPTQPLLFVSDAFCEMSGYGRDEIVGKNCRFLQGEDSDPHAVDAIRSLINSRQEGFVRIVNYTKDGRVFDNNLYLTPLGTKFFMGCQCAVAVSSAISSTSSNLVVLDHVSGTMVIPNEVPAHFESKYIRGGGVFVKTVTHPNRDARVQPYFEGKRRMFEIQVQFQLKEQFDTLFENSTLYFAAYLEKPMQLGYVQHGLIKMLVSFFSRMGSPGTSITVGDEVPNCKPGFCGPLGSTADRVVRGAEGRLGVPMLPETSFQKELKKEKKPGAFRPGEAYTVSFHSMFVDFERWLLVNVPGLSAVDLRKFWGDQSLRFAIIALEEGVPVRSIYEQGTKILELEILHGTLHEASYLEVRRQSSSKSE